MPVIDTPNSITDDADSSPSATRRFGRVPARWLEDPNIGVDELAVLAALAVHAGRDGVCVVRQRVLAGLLQRSREWVCRVLARLCQPGGFVEKEHRADRDGWNLACRYRLPDLASCEDVSAGIPADYPGDPESDLSGMGTDGAACDPAPLGPATPALGDPVAPAPAGVIASVPADMTGRAHHQILRLGTAAFRRQRKAGRPEGEKPAVLNWPDTRDSMVIKGQWAEVWRRPALPEDRPTWGRSGRW